MKKVLIIDEKVFSSICSAILELEGLKVEVFDISSEYLSLFRLKEEFGLIITSYPIICPLVKDIQESKLPIIILADQINREVINLLENIPMSYCMVKPLNYKKFRLLTKELMNKKRSHTKNYNYKIF